MLVQHGRPSVVQETWAAAACHRWAACRRTARGHPVENPVRYLTQFPGLGQATHTHFPRIRNLARQTSSHYSSFSATPRRVAPDGLFAFGPPGPTDRSAGWPCKALTCQTLRRAYTSGLTNVCFFLARLSFHAGRYFPVSSGTSHDGSQPRPGKSARVIRSSRTRTSSSPPKHEQRVGSRRSNRALIAAEKRFRQV